MTSTKHLQHALISSDIRGGWALRNSWWSLSKQALRVNYRRTTLGPFWISIQQLGFVAGISLLYSQLFKISSSEIVPIAAFGISFWSLLTGLVVAAASGFIQQAESIKSSTLPLSFYIFYSVSQQFLIFLHSALILCPLAFLFDTVPRTISLITVPLAICFAIVNGLSLGLWLGPLCTRYRDVAVAVPTIIQLAMFLSPIFWTSNLLGNREWIIDFNPIAWMIETFRSPILGGDIRLDLWARLVILTCANMTIGVVVLHRVRDKISYWI